MGEVGPRPISPSRLWGHPGSGLLNILVEMLEKPGDMVRWLMSASLSCSVQSLTKD